MNLETTTECRATLDHLFYMRKYEKTGVQGLGWVGVWYITKLEQNFCIGKKTEKKSKCTTQVRK